MGTNQPEATRSLTAVEVQRLHSVIDACNRTAPVKWVSDIDQDRVCTGVARTVSPFDGSNRTGANDVRDQFLHISGVVEHWLPIRDVVTMLARGELHFQSGNGPR